MVPLSPAGRNGTLVVGADGRLLSCTSTFAALVGRSRRELEGLLPPYPFWPPDTPRRLRERAEADARGDDNSGPSMDGARVVLRHADGSVRYAHAEVALLAGALADPCLVIAVHGLGRTEAEEQLAPDDGEQPLSATFEQAPVGIGHVAPDGRWLRVNDRLCQIVGHSREALSGRSCHEITHTDDLRRDLKLAGRLLAGQVETYATEKRFIRPDGSAVWVNLTASLVHSASGAASYFIHIIDDISARKASDERAQSLARFPEENPNPVVRLAADGQVVYANAAAVALLATLGGGIGLPAPPDWQRAATTALSTGSRSEIEVVSGTTIYGLDIRPVPSERYVYVYATDITLRKRRAEQLRLAHDIDRGILAASSPDGIAASTAFRLRALVRGEYAALVLFDHDTGLSRVLAVDATIDTSALPSTPLTVAGFRHIDRNPAEPNTRAYDCASTPSMPEFFRRLSAAGLRSFVAADLAVEGEVIGQICIAATGPSWFGPHDMHSVEDVAAQVSVAMQQSLLRERLHSHSLRLEQLVEERTAQLTASVSALEREVTEHQRAVERLREAQQRLALLLSATPAVIYSYQLSPTGYGRVTFISDNLTLLLGYRPQEFTENAEAWAQNVHPDDAPRTYGRLDEAFRGAPSAVEYRFRHRDGGYRWLRDDCRLLRDADGNPLEAVGVIVDITERRAAEDRVARQAELLAGMNDVLQRSLSSDSDEQFAHSFLAVAEQLTGSRCGFVYELTRPGFLTAIAVSARGWQACGLDADAASAQLADLPLSSYWGRVLTEGRSQIVHDPDAGGDRRDLPAGHPPISSFLGVPMLLGGRPYGVVALANRPDGYTMENQQSIEALTAVFSEALHRRRAEQDVKNLNRDLERNVAELAGANKQLESFSYSISHDLRAPLRAIDGFSRLVVDRHSAGLPEEARRYLGFVRANVSQMGRLIDDLLAFSRLTRQVPHPAPVSSAEAVREVLDLLQPERVGRNVEIVVGALPDCHADPTLVRQVWQNLIGNALKFTRQRDPARIEVGSFEQGDDVVYFVKDNGVGFDMSYADKLFGVFQRLHRSEEFDGTGVGLAVVQRIVNGHGGRIWADAQPDAGATFYFTLERLPVSAKTPPLTAEAPFAGTTSARPPADSDSLPEVRTDGQ